LLKATPLLIITMTMDQRGKQLALCKPLLPLNCLIKARLYNCLKFLNIIPAALLGFKAGRAGRNISELKAKYKYILHEASNSETGAEEIGA
jgi:hypothetical protein